MQKYTGFNRFFIFRMMGSGLSVCTVTYYWRTAVGFVDGGGREKPACTWTRVPEYGLTSYT